MYSYTTHLNFHLQSVGKQILKLVDRKFGDYAAIIIH